MGEVKWEQSYSRSQGIVVVREEAENAEALLPFGLHQRVFFD
jgi:hypothetical protein